MVNASSINLDVACENCIRASEYLTLCGTKRRCGLLCGEQIILPFCHTESFRKFRSGKIEK